VVLVALVAAATIVALAGSGSGGAAEPGAAATKMVGTGTVARRTLAERVTVEGTIGYAGETTVLARLSGTVTALPAIGDVVRRGERLYALAGEPVLLMYGAVPAYRTLAEGVSEGVDVEQLERNLAALGYEPGTVDEEFSSTTAEAIDAWQEDLGLEASGEVELGRVAFLRGPQRVTELEATLGEALGGGGGGGGENLVAWKPQAEEEEPAEGDEGIEEAEEAPEVEEPPADEEATKPKQEPEPDSENQAKPEAQEQATSPSPEQGSPESGAEPEADSEAESEPASTPVLHTSSTGRVVTVDLDPDQQSIAKRGQKVSVVLPGGAQVQGEVRRLTTVESSSEGMGGEESEAAVEATIAVTGKRRIPALDGAAVSVLFTQRVRKDVLSVPLTALVAIGGERFAVYVREGGSRRRIVVTPGLAADGYVEVEGKGLRAGMTVETGG
jgi:peptidoglycan hydrolase-like protein with peptidoglycan-binding domain